MIDTKINPLPAGGKGVDGSLSAEKIRGSIGESFGALGVSGVGVGVLYCHMPDPGTRVGESAGAFEEGFGRGEFREVCRFCGFWVEDGGC